MAMLADNDADNATRAMLDKRLKIRREGKFSYLCTALDNTSTAVPKSWTITGIVCCMFNEIPSTEVSFGGAGGLA